MSKIILSGINRASRYYATAAASTAAKWRTKPEGDISSVFASLSNKTAQPLPERYASIKEDIMKGNIEAVEHSWHELLKALGQDLHLIKEKGNLVIPVVDYGDVVTTEAVDDKVLKNITKRGVCIVRGVFKPWEALKFKDDIREYINANPTTKAFPPDDPQVYELYWSPSQIRARADERMLDLQRFFVSLWHENGKPLASLDHLSEPSGPSSILTYADRLRIRQPGDARFALGPHVDGGGVERWEDPIYRACYQPIFEGRWMDFDPFDIGTRKRADINMNMHDTAGGCSVFRAWQGWLSMSETGPGEGTLRVLPLTGLSTAYWLLRPFFAPSLPNALEGWSPNVKQLLLHGAVPGRGQEMSPKLHPHLDLEHTVVSIPKVEPGDVVMWHSDTIHAVESVHHGNSDSSVMYIPAVPSTPINIEYAAAQRSAFEDGIPPPDFPGGTGESGHIGRATKDLIEETGGSQALMAMGY